MSIKRDRKLVNSISVVTGILFFCLIMGVVIFSLPTTDKEDKQDTTVAAKTTEAVTEAAKATKEKSTEQTSAKENIGETVIMEKDDVSAGGQKNEQETTETESETETETETETEAETKAEATTIKLVAVGDNLLHKGLMDWVLQPDGTYDMSNAYSALPALTKDADICIMNEEVPIGGKDIGLVDYPNFNAVYEVADELHRVGINVLTTATNHVLDMGYSGVANMLSYFATNYPEMLLTGAYLNWEERDKTPIMEVQGIKVAILDYTYGLNGHSSSEVIVNLMDPQLITEDITRAKQNADFIIVCIHWGDENIISPNQNQIDFANLIAETGADLIIGTHPHVVQPVDIINTSDGREVLCYYSLGNYISLQHTMANMLGGIAKVEITKDSTGTHITGHSFDYCVTHFEKDHYGCRTILWEDYTRELAAIHGMPAYDPGFSYDALKAIVDNISAASK